MDYKDNVFKKSSFSADDARPRRSNPVTGLITAGLQQLPIAVLIRQWQNVLPELTDVNYPGRYFNVRA